MNVTNVIPVNHPPSAKYAQGNKSNPDQPTKTKRSRFNQSSIKEKSPFLFVDLSNSYCHN
jgi:hypothetical protein